MSAPDLGPLRDPLCHLPAYCRQAVEAERQRTYAAGVAAETGRQSEVIRHLNARCDHLGMALRDSKVAGVAAGVPDVDAMAQYIRQIDGDNTMGAGALAEKLCEWLAASPTPPAEPVVPDGEWIAEEWERLAWHLCAEEHGEDACNDLLWEGGSMPEPWGDRWMKYEPEAQADA